MLALARRLLAAYRYCHVLDARSAARLLLPIGSPEMLLQVRGVGPARIRRNKVDRVVLRQVFIERQYDHPFTRDPPPRFIVDAGANIGLASIYFATAFPAATILAIEPDADNFRLLTANVAPFQNVIPRKAALWGRSEPVGIANPDAEPWLYTVRADGAGGIRGVTLSEIVSEFGPIDILKMDIEGAEKDVFEGDVESWLPRVRVLCIELHDHMRPGSVRAVYSALVRRAFQRDQRGEIEVIRLSSAPDG
jgi:FkbM family methyltransferase